MENFLTWDTLTTYASFVSIVFMVVEFTKELPVINKIHTKYWAFLIALILLIITNIVMNNFKLIDIVLYILTAMSISLGANGLSNFNSSSSSNTEE